MSEDLPLTPDDVSEIVALLDGGGYDRLDVATRRFRLRVRRAEEGGWTQEWDWQDGPAQPTAIAVDAAAVPVDEGEGSPVRAPLPGTFYRAPQPGAPPFVQVGDTVEPETVVGIIETMKLMNPVHAGIAGTIAAVVVDNASLVDADAVLLRVIAA